jgi:2-polyprenyl-3-methyl-5-hydroxy-6-metoxy-1,4-benzoquinol methylase
LWAELPSLWELRAGDAQGRFRVQQRHKQRALQYFLRRAKDYHRIVERGPLKLLRRRERTAVLELAGFRPKETMLDVGCGQGFYAIEAKRRGMKVCALDVLPSMVAPLAATVDQVVVGDIEDFRSGAEFDCVVCAGVLDFVLDPHRAFSNLCRLVAPGGRLVLLVPRSGPGGLIYRLEKMSFGMRINFFDIQWFWRVAVGTPMVVRRWAHPLPFNTAVLLQRRCSRPVSLAEPCRRISLRSTASADQRSDSR